MPFDEYTWIERNQVLSFEEIVRLAKIFSEFGIQKIRLTGGEPLLQPGAIPLLSELCDAGKHVLLETSGEAPVDKVDPRVHKIMDLKAPGSPESSESISMKPVVGSK